MFEMPTITGTACLCARNVALAICVATIALPSAARAQDDAPDGGAEADLAKKLSNPVASLISVPIQGNYDFGIGPSDAGSLTVNIQPVIPFKLDDDWNLITRTIVPVRWRDSVAPGVKSSFGLGDTVASLFFSPNDTVGGWILGGGPVFLLPTATESAFQSRQFGLGPTFVGLRQQDGWTYGGLVNHVWGVTNPDTRSNVNATFLQPFVSYTTPSAMTFAVNTETTYDWTASEWTVPINASVSQLVKFGSQPVSFQLGARYYATAPKGGPDWGLRFSTTFLFPE